MNNKMVWIAAFLLCLFGSIFVFFGSMFIKFLYDQSPLIGMIAFMVSCILLTNLIYVVISDKECEEKRDKNE